MTQTILYIHGMGGGSSSRIPNLLDTYFREQGIPLHVVCPTYDFDPEVAHPFLLEQVCDLKPSLIIGESLGAIHALRIPEIPKLMVSPALGGPKRLCRLAPWTLFPGVSWICRRFIWHVKYPDRQQLRFRYRILRHYGPHYEALLAQAAFAAEGCLGPVHAFIGTRDHYLRSGVVDPDLWTQLYGADTLTRYEGTHFMEEEPIREYLIPAILRTAGGL